VPFTTKRLVLVVFVPVALIHVRFANEDGEVEETVSVETKRFVVVTLLNVALLPFRVVLLRVVIVDEVESRFVIVPVAAVRFVVEAFTIAPFVAYRFVVVTFVEVTFAKLPFQRSAGEPRARVASREGRKFAVDVPPANWMAFVVAAPAFVTD